MTAAQCHVDHVEAGERTRTVDLWVMGDSDQPAPLITGAFTAWVPMPMNTDGRGVFRMRFVIPSDAEFHYRVLESTAADETVSSG